MSGAAKECGDCSLCCKTFAIPELNKPKDTWCQHYLRGTGCTIYDKRPQPCRTFSCHWLLDPRWGPEWKPNKAKFVLYAENSLTLSIHPDPSTAEPWRREPYYSALCAQAANALQRGAMVLIAERGHTKIFLPDGVMDLGVVTPDQRIVVEQRHEGARVVYAPRVTSAEEAKALGGAARRP